MLTVFNGLDLLGLIVIAVVALLWFWQTAINLDDRERRDRRMQMRERCWEEVNDL